AHRQAARPPGADLRGADLLPRPGTRGGQEDPVDRRRGGPLDPPPHPPPRALSGVVPDTRIRRLDGIRGAAVLLVVVYHAGYLTAGWGPRLLPGGFVGVDLFFVLSGFLITRLLLVELDASGGIALGRFGLRRLWRLFPALFAAVAAVGALLIGLDRVGSGIDQMSWADLLTSAGGT